MEVISVGVRLVSSVALLLAARCQKSDAAFLRVSPTRLQFFDYESVSFFCDGFSRPVELRGVKNNQRCVPACANETMLTTLSCTIDHVFQPDTGEYWCEDEGGEKSNRVTIGVTDGSVILESPFFPVMEGETVTLRCTQRHNLLKSPADFYKDGLEIWTSYTGEMTIDGVSKSDEGLYKCDISAAGGSPENRLVVMNNHSSLEKASHRETPVLLLCRNVFIMVTVALMMLLVGLLHCGKLRGG